MLYWNLLLRFLNVPGSQQLPPSPLEQQQQRHSRGFRRGGSNSHTPLTIHLLPPSSPPPSPSLLKTVLNHHSWNSRWWQQQQQRKHDTSILLLLLVQTEQRGWVIPSSTPCGGRGFVVLWQCPQESERVLTKCQVKATQVVVKGPQRSPGGR